MPTKPTKFNVAAGGRLRKVREALGLRSGEFAAFLGISGSRLSNWEKGDHAPDSEILHKLKERYGVTLDYIFFSDPRGLPHDLAEKILRPRLVTSPPEPEGAQKRHRAI